MNIQCFMMHKTGFTYRYLRRYVGSDVDACPNSAIGYHNAFVYIDKGLLGEPRNSVQHELDKTDPRWPKNCSCGYEFKPEDEWQIFIKNEYSRADNKDVLYTLDDAPAGAMWNADWLNDMPEYTGPDGLSLTVRLPNGFDWLIDHVASNCDSPCKHCGVIKKDHPVNDSAGHYYEDSKLHKCWVRHGTPPNITVNKDGITCGAGAGSIQAGSYHGFLTNGELIET